MRRKILGFLCVALACAAPAFTQGSAPPAGNTPLDTYLAQLKTLRASFEQSVTDGRGETVQRATGKFVILRPGRFRWEVLQDGATSAQLMVADGKNLWFYDADLEQVSVKSASAALPATPASLLSGDEDIRELFRVSSGGKRDGFDWVVVTPKGADADFREARLGFGNGELKGMVLKDKLGQTVRLQFLSSKRNAPVSESEVTFAPPAGADVIGTPIP
ncbi:MAG: outer membrane lipoprotein chaperone LolA [Steroidobacteraceae bacterium]|nr:outer membrane lipoprotein chaperone LolA [Steroidobacteraceae bacterium]